MVGAAATESQGNEVCAVSLHPFSPKMRDDNLVLQGLCLWLCLCRLCLGPPVPHQEEQAKLDSVLLPISISHPLMLPRQYVFNPVFLGLNSSSRSSYWSSLCSVPQRCGLLRPAQPHPAVSSPTPRPGNVDDDHARVQVTI